MEKLLAALELTPGSNEKKKLIAEASPEEIEGIVLALDPFKTTGIKKLPKLKHAGTRTYADNYLTFRALFDSLVKREITGKKATEAVVGFLETCTEPTAEVFRRIITGKIGAGVAAATVNSALGHEAVKTFKVQLANPYSPEKKYNTDIWYVSPKLNGLRGFWRPGWDTIKSREGHPFSGFSHIVKELEALALRYGFDFVDGELFDKDTPFQTIQSYVRSGSCPEEKKKLIQFNVFAVGQSNMFEMVFTIHNEVQWEDYQYLKNVGYSTCDNDPAKLSDMMRMYAHDGYEGIMLRNPNIPYEFKRSDALLKYKPFIEADFEIIGLLPGKDDGRFLNTLGSVVVSGPYTDPKGNVFDVCCEVGSGFVEFSTDKDGNRTDDFGWNGGDWGAQEKPSRDWMWANRDKLIGKKIEVQFQTLSDKPDPVSGTWSLQFPTFRALKLDR